MSKEEKKCPLLARYRFTWPGQKERIVCQLHASQIQAITVNIEFFVEFIEIEYEEEKTCTQSLSQKEIEALEKITE